MTIIIIKVVYFIALIAALTGLIGLLNSIGFGGGNNVMQQTGIIAFSIGLAVVPYCIARAVEKLLS